MVTKMKSIGVKGFSLVELMIVVAIIGILAAVAIPNFQRFQRKARQSEATAMLGAIQGAQAAFHGQWENYSTELDIIGYVPSGTLRYNAGFLADVDFSSGAAPVGYTGINPMPGNRFDTALVCAAYATQCTGIGTAIVGAVAPAGAGNAATFTAAAAGVIGGAANDQWTMTQLKVLMNTQDGTL
jgi:type IV pilus assembly protein PilA